MNNSILRIWRIKGRNRFKALCRYTLWQLYKKLHLFPRIVKISNSSVSIKSLDSANAGGGLLFTHGMYDYNNMHLLKLINQEPQVYYDIGANKGVYSLLASENSKTKVYAFEPHPLTFIELNDNIKLNEREVSTFNIALGNINGKVKFSDKPGSSINKVLGETPQENFIVTDMVRLDDFISQGRELPTIMKIDVEGHEHQVINGGTQILRNVKLIQIEENATFLKVVDILVSHGFSGPYYYEHLNRKLHQERFVSSEDPIFINGNYLSFFIKQLKINLS